MEATLTGRAATESLMLYMRLADQRFDAAKVRADVIGRSKRAKARIRLALGLLTPIIRSIPRPRPHTSVSRRVRRPLRRFQPALAVPDRPPRPSAVEGV